MFANYKKLEHNEQQLMSNSTVSKVEEKGNVILKWTSRKELTLNEVLHIPDIHKNLNFESILNKKGFRMVFEFDNLHLLRVGCMWVRVILLMVF